MRLIVRLALASLAALAFAPGVAQAQAQESIPSTGVFKTGAQINALCISKNATEVAQCESFLMAAHDSFAYFQDIGEIDKAICVPRGTTAATLREVATAYWRDNPTVLKFSAVSSLWNALLARFPAPCG